LTSLTQFFHDTSIVVDIFGATTIEAIDAATAEHGLGVLATIGPGGKTFVNSLVASGDYDLALNCISKKSTFSIILNHGPKPCTTQFCVPVALRNEQKDASDLIPENCPPRPTE
jgi:hypothetical protein